MIKSFTIVGDKELSNLFKQLPDRVSSRSIIASARKAAAPVRKRAREKVPVKTGNLKKGIKIIASKSKKWPHVIVGPNYFKGGARAPHAHLVAYASKPRKTKSGANRGRSVEHKSPLGPFIAEAAGEVKEQVFSSLKAGLVVVLDREIRKLIK